MITCKFENGNEDSLRHVTIASIIVKDGKILLARRGTFQGKPILESGKWGLTGGFLDRNENLIQGAIREAAEELDIKIDNLKLMHITDRPNRPGEDRQNVAFTFIANALSEPKLISEEVTEIRWFNIDELPDNKEIAFDFSDDLILYKKYLKEKFSLPILG
jgi:ADP-ribose pyrophosphatase YjhB (NUDIX family)